jgi:uncharacterized membrane protein YdbT with pleckstrin-like domain
MPDIFVSPEGKTEASSDHEGSATILPEKEPHTEKQRQAVPGHSHKKLSSFSVYPDNVGFETEEKEERIVLLLRQHPIINVRWIFVTGVLIVVPQLVRYLGMLSTLPTGFEMVITLAWYLVTMAYALENFLSWYFNVYFVTDERVVDVDFYNLIDKRVSEASLDKIQDVSYTTAGVMGTLLNFGHVFIQTAAEVSEFQFESVPNPEKVTKMLEDLKEKKEGDNK